MDTDTKARVNEALAQDRGVIAEVDGKAYVFGPLMWGEGSEVTVTDIDGTRREVVLTQAWRYDNFTLAAFTTISDYYGQHEDGRCQSCGERTVYGRCEGCGMTGSAGRYYM